MAIIYLQNYEIMESIGQGAFAIAYRGYQRTTGQEVAIKMVGSFLYYN